MFTCLYDADVDGVSHVVYTYTKPSSEELHAMGCPFRYLRVRDNLWMDIRFVELFIHLPVRQ